MWWLQSPSLSRGSSAAAGMFAVIATSFQPFVNFRRRRGESVKRVRGFVAASRAVFWAGTLDEALAVFLQLREGGGHRLKLRLGMLLLPSICRQFTHVDVLLL